MYDNQEHYHNSDRFPSKDTLRWLTSLETVKQITTATYAITEDDDILLADASSISMTVTLPPPRNGRKLVISEEPGGSHGNTFVVVPNGTETIDGAASINMRNLTRTFKVFNGNWVTW